MEVSAEDPQKLQRELVQNESNFNKMKLPQMLNIRGQGLLPKQPMLDALAAWVYAPRLKDSVYESKEIGH